MNIIERQLNKLRARQLYTQLSQRSEGTTLTLICPHGIGDTYVVCAFASRLKQQTGAHKVIVITKPSQQSIPLLFEGIDESISMPLDPDVLHFMPSLYTGVPFTYPGVFVAHMNYYPSGDITRSLGYKLGDTFFSMTDAYRVLFGWSDRRVPLSKPRISTSIHKRAQHRFRTWKVRKGKTVLLAPETTTTANIQDQSSWKELAAALEQKGFDVVTMCVGNEARYLHPVSFPLDEAIPLAELCGTVVSMRSGFVDLLSSAKTRLVIAYPDVPWGVGRFMNAGSLRSMGLRSGMKEILVKLDISVSVFVKKIVTAVTG